MALRQSRAEAGDVLAPQHRRVRGPQDDPVRAYDAFGDALDGRSLGIEADPHQAGCPAYPPTVMLKILV